jgi:hypothetical protein
MKKLLIGVSGFAMVFAVAVSAGWLLIGRSEASGTPTQTSCPASLPSVSAACAG